MSEPLRVASVGLGRWAEVIATAVARSDKIEIVNCFSRSEEKRTAFAEKFGCDHSTSYEEMLADERIEGVLLTTPNSAHAETVEQAAAAGKHIWIEKPISHKITEAMRIREAIEKSGITFSVGHSARMLGASRKMKQLIDDGSLGTVTLIEANWSNERALELTPDDWRWYADATPGGPMIQLLVHHFDTLQYLLGPVAEVKAYKRRVHTNAEVNDTAVIIAEFESGNLGYFGSSWVSPGIYWMNIYGTEANLYHTLNFSYWKDPEVDKYTTLTRQEHGSLEAVPVEVPMKDMFVDELEDFVDAVRSKRDPEIGWIQATQALAVVEAAIRSSDEGRPVKISEILG
jgi:predicted dehydrogenase